MRIVCPIMRTANGVMRVVRRRGLFFLAAGMLAAWSTGAAVAGASSAAVECPDCPAMMRVPAGRFTMGVVPDEEDLEQLADAFRGRSEPRRSVEVASFSIGIHEVTRRQFDRFVQATGHRADGCFVWSGREFVDRPDRNWRTPGFGQDDDHPVVCVSWNDAQAYARWLGELTGRPYRLPSEAEWEYVARAGSRAIRFWGDDPALACRFANGADASVLRVMPDATEGSVHPCDDGYVHTSPVGRFEGNEFGVHDMLGNAAEWTQDCWQPDYRQARTDAVPMTAGECALRAVRGGAWDEGPAGLRVAYRVGSPATVRVYGRGFRVARDD